MLFTYKAVDNANVQREGTVEAPSIDAAISAVQKRGYTLVSIDEVDKAGGLAGVLNVEFNLFQSVSYKDIVILSRQISTLFQAQVSPLRIFRLLSAEVENPLLQKAMNQTDTKDVCHSTRLKNKCGFLRLPRSYIRMA